MQIGGLKMKSTINDLLLMRAEQVAEEADRMQLDSKFYMDVQRKLPRLFPAPDEVAMRPRDSEYDILFIYASRSDEQVEALRIVLSLAFQISEWQGELLKEGGLFSIFAPCSVGDYVLLLKIVGVSLSDYDFKTSKDTGTRLIGPIKCKKFVPLDIARLDASPDLFANHGRDVSIGTYLSRMQSKILSLAGHNIPSKVPPPDNIITGYGVNFDIDLVYFNDSNGKLRRRIDKYLGYSGWSIIVHKPTLTITMHTLIDVQCENLILKVRVSILNPFLPAEQVIFVEETPDRLLYRAFRNSDPDYKQIL